MTDRLFALRVLLRTARTGSFSRASRELGLSQSSVSRIVAELERDLGVTLLARTTRAVSLTDAGADYLARIEPVLDALEEADHAARGTGTLRGTLRIALSSSFGLREVVPRLSDFLLRHPELRVDLAVSDIHQDLVMDGVDVAFRLGALADSTEIARKLGQSPRILAASPDYLAGARPIEEPANLSDHGVILGPGAVPRVLTFSKGDRRLSVKVEGRITCAVNEGATAVAVAGLGITVSSLWGIRAELERGELVRLLPDWTLLPAVDLHAVFPPGRIPTPAARAFVEHFALSLAKGM
jgi:DNA-binding transcriptional LysR family regulator